MADYAQLVDARFRAGFEAEAGLFVAEGHLAVERLLTSPYPLRSLVVAEPRASRFSRLMAQASGAGATVAVVSPQVLAQVTGFDVHRGVLAIGERTPQPTAVDLLGRPGILVAVEGCNDGENMGAVGRNAAAFGAGGLLLDPTCCDPLTRRAVRVSLGHILGLPLARVVPWPDGLCHPEAPVLALTPHPEAESLYDCVASLAASPPRTLVVAAGAEGPGLSPQLLARATHRVRIPMAAGVDSLNLAIAVAVALSHLRKAWSMES